MTIVAHDGSDDCVHLWVHLDSLTVKRQPRTIDEELRAPRYITDRPDTQHWLWFNGERFYCQHCLKITTIFQEQGSWDPEQEL